MPCARESGWWARAAPSRPPASSERSPCGPAWPEPTGCVTELPELRGPALPAFADLVFGGHDVVATPLTKKAEALAAAGVLPGRLVTALADDLAGVERRAAARPRPATARPTGSPRSPPT